jgi:excisionase family DNA binding protein
VNDPLRFLSLAEAARLVGVHEDVLRPLLERGEIGALLNGRHWRIPRRSLEVWQERIALGERVAAPVAEAPRRGRPRRDWSAA